MAVNKKHNSIENRYTGGIQMSKEFNVQLNTSAPGNASHSSLFEDST